MNLHRSQKGWVAPTTTLWVKSHKKCAVPATSRLKPLLAVACLLLVFAPQGAHALDFTKQPYLQHVTKTSMTICWETDSPASGKISYGVTKNLEGVLPLTGAETFREATLTGLKQDTEYFFLVDADGLQYRGRFKTAPPPGKPFRLVSYGDFRVGPVEVSLVKKMLGEKPDIAVTTGDYLSSGIEESLWPHLFRMIEPLARRVPYYVTLGNHEDDSPIYFDYFAMPGGERWYSFDYGNVHFIALDSNAPYKTDPAQKRFLENDLKAARADSDIDFIFVFFHHPPFATGKRSGDTVIVANWVPIFEKYKVGAVLNGHEHNYERFVVNGITYIVTGGGGASLYNFDHEDPRSVARAVRYHYTIFDVEQTAIRVRAVALEGDVLDKFVLNKKK